MLHNPTHSGSFDLFSDKLRGLFEYSLYDGHIIKDLISLSEIVLSHLDKFFFSPTVLGAQPLLGTTTPMYIVLVDGDIHKVFCVFGEDLVLAFGVALGIQAFRVDATQLSLGVAMTQGFLLLEIEQLDFIARLKWELLKN